MTVFVGLHWAGMVDAATGPPRPSMQVAGGARLTSLTIPHVRGRFKLSTAMLTVTQGLLTKNSPTTTRMTMKSHPHRQRRTKNPRAGNEAKNPSRNGGSPGGFASC